MVYRYLIDLKQVTVLASLLWFGEGETHGLPDSGFFCRGWESCSVPMTVDSPVASDNAQW